MLMDNCVIDKDNQVAVIGRNKPVSLNWDSILLKEITVEPTLINN